MSYRETLHREVTAKARKYAEGKADADDDALEPLEPEIVEVIETAYHDGYMDGRAQALAQVAANLRSMPEGALPGEEYRT